MSLWFMRLHHQNGLFHDTRIRHKVIPFSSQNNIIVILWCFPNRALHLSLYNHPAVKHHVETPNESTTIVIPYTWSPFRNNLTKISAMCVQAYSKHSKISVPSHRDTRSLSPLGSFGAELSVRTVSPNNMMIPPSDMDETVSRKHLEKPPLCQGTLYESPG